ncbi:hypothetical protein B0A49_01406 [Cryomyces minteri]|uniref:Chloride channel protein n=1 Tax=Cryomyces minteri TaxID=331657 RepID=A0A4U0XNU0_9PEZI|nr:hypothetical protein B0A49_01406 [Cryomyces minteri]
MNRRTSSISISVPPSRPLPSTAASTRSINLTRRLSAVSAAEQGHDETATSAQQAISEEFDEIKRYEDFTTIDWVQDAAREQLRRKARRQEKAGHFEREGKIGWRERVRESYDAGQAWIVVSLVGAAIGLNAAFLNIVTEWLSDVKLGYCTTAFYLNENFCCWGAENGCDEWHRWSSLWPMNYILYVLFSTVFAFTSARLVKSFAPYAAGSGISEIKCIITGFVMKGFLGSWTLLIKSTGLPLAIASGLSVGKEGPSVHYAVCTGNVISRFFDKYRRNAARTREILSACAAAGVAVAFGSPIGGVLFSLEEMSSYFPLKTMWRSYFCALVATAVLAAMNPFRTGQLVMFQVKYDRSWHFFEIVFFIIIGIFGGLYGAFVIKWNLRAQAFRKKYLTKYAILEVTLLAAFTAVLCYPNMFLRIDMTESMEILFLECEGGHDYDELCEKKNRWSMILSLAIATVLRTFLVIISYGCKVPAGIFVPSMAIGASFGRMVGILVQALHESFPDSRFFSACQPDVPCITPGTYAFLGAGAALSGIMHITVSVVVVMFELTGALTYILPTMIVVGVTKAVSDRFGKGGIADCMIWFNGFPFLDNKEEHTFGVPVSQVMTSSMTLLSASGLELRNVEKIVDESKFQGFPIVEDHASKTLLGYIGRTELRYAVDRAKRDQTATRPAITPSTVSPAISFDTIDATFSQMSVDFSKFIDPTPLTVHPRLPLETVMELFKKMGPRVILVEYHGRLTGLVTVKDCLKYQFKVEAQENPRDDARLERGQERLWELLRQAAGWPKGARDAMAADTAITDPRFSNIHTDPRYRLPSRKHNRTAPDKRFSRMFKDEDFSKKASVDRYGRKLAKGTGRKELERLYRVADDEEEEEDDNDDDDPVEEQDVVADDAEVQKELARLDRKYDPARDGGFSSSSEEDSSSDEEDGSEVEDAEDGTEGSRGDEQEAEAIPMGEISSRVAAVNLDWDNIRAVDLMAVASSFAPNEGQILKVTIYPSEFGKERIEREEMEGPPREIFASSNRAGDVSSGDEDEDEDEEEAEEKIKKQLLRADNGEEFDSGKLRQYQLDRLKYYYAVVTCDSPSTAKALYDAMDSREYLTTANFFDLRFIPDGVSFDDDKPRDICERIPDGYRPNEFVTDALTHSKVRLTWDADDATRKEVQKRAFSRAEIDDNDLQAYVGSDSSDDEGATVTNGQSVEAQSKKEKAEAQRQKMRAALGLTAEPVKSSSKTKNAGPVGDMQVTFSSGLSSIPQKGSVFENEPIVEETTREKYIRLEKERKARRKEKSKAARDGATVTNESADVATTLAPNADSGDAAGKGAEEEDDPFNDPFFTDPTASRAADKATRKADRHAKRAQRAAEAAASAAQKAELELLMVDDKDSNLKHFNMNEIRKAEKAKRNKKGNKGRTADADGGEREAGKEAAPAFEMDVQDPRFRGLYESHEFAIDPTNPRFKGTEGMKKLLEEGRRKRKGEVDEDGAADMADERRHKKTKKANTDEDGGSGGGDNLKKLVERVKGKSKKRT